MKNLLIPIYIGNYGSFDRLAAKAVIQAKNCHPEIILSMLIPYHPAERPIVPSIEFDNTSYPSGMKNVPRKHAIVRANSYMEDHVDYLVAYVWHPTSNARNILEYAERRSQKVLLIIENIAHFPLG